VGLGVGVGFAVAEALAAGVPDLPLELLELLELLVGVPPIEALDDSVAPPAKNVPVGVGAGLLSLDPK
jgi:hypothetical protein